MIGFICRTCGEWTRSEEGPCDHCGGDVWAEEAHIPGLSSKGPIALPGDIGQVCNGTGRRA